MPAVPDAATLARLFGGAFTADPDRLRRYEIPERGEPGRASGLIVAQSEAEVAATLVAASANDVPLVIAAGRTGLVEAQRPDGEVVLSLERLDRALSFTLGDGSTFAFDAGTASAPDAASDALAAWWRALGQPPTADAVLEVEAGVAVDAVNRILEPLGLMWPMEMGSSSAASVGGCIANASAGANAVCYGTAAHLALQAFGYSGDGRAIVSDAPQWKPVPADVLAINSAEPRPALGLIGTQGTLGVITRARLRTYPIPVQREAALIPAQDMPAAMKILSAARARFGADIEEFEFIGRAAFDLVRRLKGEAFRSPLARDDAPYVLLLQVKAHRAEVDLASALYEFLADDLGLDEADIGYAPLKALKEIRHSITEASNARMRALGGGRLSFDTATPVAVFGDYLRVLEAELRAEYPALTLIAFGHAGVGGAHLHVLGSSDAPVAPIAEAVIRIVFDVTQDFGGTFSAEHGVGPKWGAAFLARTPKPVQDALAAAKREHDPRLTLAPRSFAMDRLLTATASAAQG